MDTEKLYYNFIAIDYDTEQKGVPYYNPDDPRFDEEELYNDIDHGMELYQYIDWNEIDYPDEYIESLKFAYTTYAKQTFEWSELLKSIGYIRPDFTIENPVFTMPEPINRIISDVLHEIIEERRDRLLKYISQAEIAEKLDVNESTISRYFNGDTYPDTDTLIKLCIYLRTNAKEAQELFQTCPQASLCSYFPHHVLFRAMCEKGMFTDPPTPSKSTYTKDTHTFIRRSVAAYISADMDYTAFLKKFNHTKLNKKKITIVSHDELEEIKKGTVCNLQYKDPTYPVHGRCFAFSE